jgi:hypothetical protein
MTTLLGVALERSAQAYKYARTGGPAPGGDAGEADEGDGGGAGDREAPG